MKKLFILIFLLTSQVSLAKSWLQMSDAEQRYALSQHQGPPSESIPQTDTLKVPVISENVYMSNTHAHTYKTYDSVCNHLDDNEKLKCTTQLTEKQY